MNRTPVKKALFILHEGIGSTIFNSQVLEHIKEMKNYGIEFDILSYNTESKIWKKSIQNLEIINRLNPNLIIILKRGINIYYPFSGLINYFLLLFFMINKRRVYEFIHARSDYTTFLCLLVKKIIKLPVVWDCRGDSLSELEDALSRKNKIIQFLSRFSLLPMQRHKTDVVCKKANAAFFVSDALFELYCNKLITNNIQIIPCPVYEKIFYFDKKLRSEKRKKMGFDLDKTVFLYSGSMVNYQSLDLQFNEYKNILKDKNQIIIYATSNPISAETYFNNFAKNQFIIISVPYTEMNSFYNVADFAFLLRDKKKLNWVASPTKFGEYCLTGLSVIMNDTVQQATINAHKVGNYVSFEEKIFLKKTDDQRSHFAKLAKELYSREVLNIKYQDLYNKICDE